MNLHEQAMRALKRAERLSLVAEPHNPTFYYAVAEAIVLALLEIADAFGRSRSD